MTVEQNAKWETGNLRTEIDGYARKAHGAYMHPELRRETLTELLGVVRAGNDLDERVLRRDARAGLVREEVEYTLTNGQKTRAVLLLPQVRRAKLPAVLALHDHGGFYYYGKEKLLENENESPLLTAFKARYYGGRAWAESLARLGYAVLVNDAFYFGGRRLKPDALREESAARYFAGLKGLDEGTDAYVEAHSVACGLYEREMAKHILLSPITWPGILLSDDMRAVDYLMTRPEVDRGRVGCCGLSLGGFRAALLAGLDVRVRCAVVTGWMSKLSAMQHRMLAEHTFMLYTPRLLPRFDLPDITGLCAPNALFVQQCLRDELFPKEAMREAEESLLNYYAEAKAGKRLKISRYNTTHAFTARMQDDAFAWFGENL